MAAKVFSCLRARVLLSKWLSLQSWGPSASTVTSLTLLLVDDNETVLRVLEYIFTRHGHRVVLAKSGAKALEVFATEAVDVALVDVNMPGLDGFQTVMALLSAARERGRGLRAWLMTGAFSSAAEKRAREIGAVALLSKPFDNAAFLAALQRP